MSAFGSGPSNGQFWYGNTTNFPGFLYKKNVGVGGRRSTKMAPGGNVTCNSSTYLYNKYKPGQGGVGASSIANRRAKNRLATICNGTNNCFPCYNSLGQYSNYTHNPNGFVPCPGTINIITPTPTPGQTYTVTYNGNGSTSGSAPTDTNSPYASGSTVTVLGNTFTRTGYVFTFWNTAANGSGTSYTSGTTFSISPANVILYAQWTPTYTLTYNPNELEGGTGSSGINSYLGGSPVTIPDSTGFSNINITKQFGGWNTALDGRGIYYPPNSTFTMPSANTILWAQWYDPSGQTHSVTYDGNTSDGGTPPGPFNYYRYQGVPISENTGLLIKTGFVFGGWNTDPSGNGIEYETVSNGFTMPDANVILYAVWELGIQLVPGDLPADMNPSGYTNLSGLNTLDDSALNIPISGFDFQFFNSFLPIYWSTNAVIGFGSPTSTISWSPGTGLGILIGNTDRRNNTFYYSSLLTGSSPAIKYVKFLFFGQNYYNDGIPNVLKYEITMAIDGISQYVQIKTAGVGSIIGQWTIATPSPSFLNICDTFLSNGGPAVGGSYVFKSDVDGTGWTFHANHHIEI